MPVPGPLQSNTKTHHPVASNETPQGRAENRPVEVKVLLNKGLNEQ